jgi:hypothetical protein
LFRVHSDSLAGPRWPDNLSSDRILIAPRRSVLASCTPPVSLPPCSSSSRASFGSACGCLLASCKAVSSTLPRSVDRSWCATPKIVSPSGSYRRDARASNRRPASIMRTPSPGSKSVRHETTYRVPRPGRFEWCDSLATEKRLPMLRRAQVARGQRRTLDDPNPERDGFCPRPQIAEFPLSKPPRTLTRIRG